ncbi:hemerythrin domain-containing protein [Myxococcus sp. MISCRS1]|jgi:hemerythrin superfamily protein|uniref:hemerythrin domain-containing protein n=1 Tax=Myxococcus TaxID=32 RepID=UPI001CBB29FC|nr:MULTISPECIES: hemerythrin domain-containing protein [unclassified Myxococcus]MBZ4398330.1 hemerythrin domain-containing protein [Myxococcus sp. AS-1-15]MBZ4412773.1 hemerythrin domain-containing protein [Myxococcus sp. XM-1-1-1]MCY0999993.1 hemerythrin domain-containing protein [Myxococcus sp. MISCRS1]BDT38462.1 hemerythrin domain-containing protein [Myxococcus sp. MH1]
MDAIALLKADHKTVEQLFRRFEKAGPNAHKLKRKLVEQMVLELSVHSSIEEQVFYPAVRQRSASLRDEVLRSLEEHHVVKWVLSELDGLPSEAERFDAKVSVLMENVRAHVLEEETTLFPEVKKAFRPNELRELGQVLEAAKQAAPTRPHPMAPDTPPGNLVAGAVSAVMDIGRDALRAARRKATTKVREVTGRGPKSRAPSAPEYEAGESASP